jgi:hypothetical protein
MFSRFLLDRTVFDNFTISDFDRMEGKKISERYKNEVKKNLDIRLLDENIIDGSATQRNWFPNIKADIFLSHSHKDLDYAKNLAGFIKNKFKLDVFIDSNIWGNSENLLKLIDDEHCYNKKTKNYDYKTRNFSTSHVHMMLSVALADMINKTECLMFLDTPNSVIAKDTINQTESPWIYNELFLSSIIQIDDKLIRSRTELFSANEDRELKNLNESLNIRYDLSVDHLVKLSGKDIREWKENYLDRLNSETHPLDVLYKQKKIRINGK